MDRRGSQSAYGAVVPHLSLEKLDDRRLLSVTPTLVGDINPTPVPSGSSYPNSFAEVSGILYYSANDGTNGFELWRSDGTAAGTQRVKDIVPGASGSSPRQLVNVNGTLYFTANHASYSHQLWKSDGSESGTVLVRELTVTPESSADSFEFTDLMNVGDRLFFRRESVFKRELWSSDGTAAGTFKLTDVADVQAAGVNGQLFFVGTDGDLWRVDGSSLAPAKVKEFGLSPNQLIDVDGELYFVINEGYWGGSTIWKSDGTEAGTVPIQYFQNSINDGVGNLTSVAGVVYFTKPDLLQGDLQLWVTDGTSAGTTLVKDFGDGYAAGLLSGFVEFDGRLFFSSSNTGLWSSDGASAGTSVVASSVDERSIGSVFRTRVVDDILYFVAFAGKQYRDNSEIYLYDLWRSDGTFEGTTRISRVAEGPYFPDGFELVALNGKPYFNNYSSFYEPKLNGRGELWTLDDAGTDVVLVKDVNGPSGPSNATDFTPLGGAMLFVANDGSRGRELWKVDSLGGQPSQLTEVRPGSASGVAGYLTPVGPFAYFISDEGARRELWRTDGTAAGTIRLTSHWADPESLVEFAGKLYFVADDPLVQGGRDVWCSDGTVAGTRKLTSFALLGSQMYPRFLTPHGDRLYFSFGPQLWSTDGSQSEPTLVKSTGADLMGYPITNLASTSGRLFFSAWDGLWSSNGTEAGTIRLPIIQYQTGRPYYQNGFVSIDENIFFYGKDDAHGYELWKSDGTVAGTQMVLDSRPGPQNAGVSYLTAVGGKLLYVNSSTVEGEQLWVSDGTAANTKAIRTFSHTWPDVRYITEVNGVAYFQANDGQHGWELWRSDGTDAGTRLAADLMPGPADSFPHSLQNVNGNLFFVANDGAHGQEPWFVAGSPAKSSGDFDRNGVVDGADFLQWQRSAGAPSGVGDANDDLAVNAADLSLWKENLNVFGSVVADFDRDGRTDGADFLAWQRGFGDSRLSADDDQSGLVDSGDLSTWRTTFGVVYDRSDDSALRAESLAAVIDELGESWDLRVAFQETPASAETSSDRTLALTQTTAHSTSPFPVLIPAVDWHRQPSGSSELAQAAADVAASANSNRSQPSQTASIHQIRGVDGPWTFASSRLRLGIDDFAPPSSLESPRMLDAKLSRASE